MMKKGDEGDCMYVTMRGECGIFLTDNALAAADAVVGANRVLGDTALNVTHGQVGKRTATVIALKEVTALVLYRQDFQNIVYQHKVIQRMERLHFLQRMAYF